MLGTMLPSGSGPAWVWARLSVSCRRSWGTWISKGRQDYGVCFPTVVLRSSEPFPSYHGWAVGSVLAPQIAVPEAAHAFSTTDSSAWCHCPLLGPLHLPLLLPLLAPLGKSPPPPPEDSLIHSPRFTGHLPTMC